MEPPRPEYSPHSIETEVLALWKARRLPPSGGVLGPGTGPAVRQVVVGWTKGDFPALVAHRAVAADVDARYLGLTGRRAGATLRQETGKGPTTPSTIPALLTRLGVWVGGDGRTPWDSEDRSARVQAILGHMAAKGGLVTRDESFRVCPSCGTTRGPEHIIYEEQEGDTYLVRFPISVGEWTVHALVWVDAPWKLLGASAILVNPNLRYVVAGYQRREERELVLTSAASLERLRSWIPDATFEVVQERAGREFQGIPYVYPLRHEFPMGGDLAPPAGTILTAADVGESGTGIVPLVPGHGPTDAQIAGRMGVAGWPLLTPKGMLDVTLMHKYAGLDLETANEFVLRDLSEAGALLARLRVKRGVPHCAVCGSPLLWAPGRAWCLEPARLPLEIQALFARLLPQETFPTQTEVAPWPVSEASTSEEPCAVALLECARCDRLDGPEGPKQCPCGGQRNLVRRRLLPASYAALAAVARLDPLPEGDSVRLYVGHRRRVPSLVNHLAAFAGLDGPFPDIGLTVIPTVATGDTPELLGEFGADAVRAALVRGEILSSSGRHFPDQCRREADRFRRWWWLAREVAAMCDSPMFLSFSRPIGAFVSELEVEDRAIVTRWERTRILALAQYDQWAAGNVHGLLTRFLDNDLVEYFELVQPRLYLSGTPPTKRAALRTLTHLLRGLSEMLAPIAPFVSESVHRAFSPERTSLYEQPMRGPDRSLLNDDLVAAWDRWRTVIRSVDRFRRSLAIPLSTVLPSIVLVLPGDDVGDRFRAEKEVLARLARVKRIEVASPREEWTGRQRVLRPIDAEIQRAYPTEASQIAHLLQRMAPRRWEAASATEEINVVINGLPRRVFPSMVAIVNTLPDRVVPVPWSLGDMYVEVPVGIESAPRSPPPPLSPDGFWLVRRTEQRLRGARGPSMGRPRVAVVVAKDPLASELRVLADPIARYLGLGEFRVVENPEQPTPPNALTGRTRTGERWRVHVPDLPRRPRREKRPKAGGRHRRVPEPKPSEEAAPFDYADEKFVAHEEEVRALGQELDDIVGLPLLGPAKVAEAWDRGIHSVEDLRRAPFEEVATLPGFGGVVAEVVVTKVRGSSPARKTRSVPRPPSPPASPAVLPRKEATPPPPRPLSPETPRLSAPVASQPEAPEPPTTAPPPAPLEATVIPETVAPVPAPSPATATETAAPPEAPAAPEVEEVPPAVVEVPPPEAMFAVPLEEAKPQAVEPSPPERKPPEPEIAPAAPPVLVEPEAAPALEAAPAPEPLAPLEAVPPAEEAPPSSLPPEEVVPGAPAEPIVTPEPTPAVVPTPAPLAPSPEPVAATPAEEPTAPPEPVPPAPTEPHEEAPLVGETASEPVPEPVPPPPEIPPVPEREAAVAQPSPMITEIPAPVAEETRVESRTPPEVVPTPPLVPEGTPPEITPPSPVPPLSPPAAAAATEVLAAPPPAERGPPSPPAGVELAIGESLVGALGGILEAAAAGHRGVCVVRESPERIRARVGPRPIEVVWLSNLGRGPSLRPSDLEGAWTFLSRKLLEDHVTAFFLEGVEYLVRLHGADAVLTGLVQFDRLARENDARVWVYLAPALMKPADLERFRSTFGSGAGVA